MTINWVKDMEMMYDEYNMKESVENMDDDTLKRFLDFRISFLEEELNELKVNRNDPEEIVDALIDLTVVSIGTLNLFGVNTQKAWDEVLNANMNKIVGEKQTRKNDLNLPDLIKPKKETHGYDWVPPSHLGNHGLLNKIVG